MMMKLRSKRFSRSFSKLTGGGSGGNGGSSSSRGLIVSSTGSATTTGDEIKWELRPGGMLVQKRGDGGSEGELITVRVSTETRWHDVTIEATSTFGELKVILAMLTGLEPREQRVLFKGKEREDRDYLHMVGVRDNDKVLLLEDPAMKQTKINMIMMMNNKQHQQQQQQQLHALARNQPSPNCPTITV